MKTPIDKILDFIPKEVRDHLERYHIIDQAKEDFKQVIIDAVEHGKEFGDIIKDDLGRKYFESIFKK